MTAHICDALGVQRGGAMQVAGLEFVLRKQPPGKLLPSAHAVWREFEVISALQATAVPVPKAVSLCKNASVLGTQVRLLQTAMYTPGSTLYG